jgi:hypothetical protein
VGSLADLLGEAAGESGDRPADDLYRQVRCSELGSQGRGRADGGVGAGAGQPAEERGPTTATPNGSARLLEGGQQARGRPGVPRRHCRQDDVEQRRSHSAQADPAHEEGRREVERGDVQNRRDGHAGTNYTAIGVLVAILVPICAAATGRSPITRLALIKAEEAAWKSALAA